MPFLDILRFRTLLRKDFRNAIWKGQNLCIRRRLTMIKSSLSSFPKYFMLVFVIQRGVSLRLEEIRRDFHLVGWSQG